jgi:hypothetical protein
MKSSSTYTPLVSGLALLLAALVPILASSGLPGRRVPPNVVLILTDDQGWGDVDVYDYVARRFSSERSAVRAS